MAAQFVQDALTAIPGVDPRPMQRSQFFSGLNDGPAGTASRIAGLVQKSDAQDNSPYYTSNFGQLLPDSGHPLNVGGIPYQGDPLLLEKQQAFDRSKITERIVHPAGWSAFGQFTVTKDVSHLTRASFLQGVGKKTPTYTRLSTVTYGVSLSALWSDKNPEITKSRFSFFLFLIIADRQREYPDSARNPRGHATKFYTEDGNFDLVGLNFPVFFVR
jgi:catalase